MIKRPELHEYKPFAADYVSLVPDGDVVALLAQLMESSYRLFSGLTDEQAAYAYAPGKWTVKQALGHMIDTERVLAYRALAFSRDNIVLPGFDQEKYVDQADFNARSIQDLAAEFKAVRQSNVYMIKGFTGRQLTRTGIASNHLFSVRAIIYMIAGHELYHLNIFKDGYGIQG